MKNSHFYIERKRLLSIFLLILFGVTLIPVLPTVAIANVRVDPLTHSYNTATNPLGFKFNVTIWIDSVTDLFAWQVAFAYNSSHLVAARAWQPSWDPQYVFYASTGPKMPLGPTYYAGIVVIGETLLPDPNNAPFTGNGKLAIVEFQIKGIPPKYGELNSNLVIATTGAFTTKLKNSAGGSISFTTTNGTFTYIWVRPTSKPNLAVDPALVEFGPSPPSAIGQRFNVTVWIKSLDVFWGLTNATFTLSFNITLIKVMDVIVNSTYWTKSNIDNTTTSGKIQVFVGSPSKYPRDDVNATTIEFSVADQGAYPSVDVSAMTLENVRLMDHVEEIPTTPPVNGSVVIKGLLPTTLEVRPHGYITDKLEIFSIEIWLNDVIKEKRLVALQFRLVYNSTLLKVLNVTEGPFLQQFGQTPRLTSEPTKFIYFIEDDYIENGVHYGPNVLVGILIWPNSTSGWKVFPDGSGVVANITFQGIYLPLYPTVSTGALQVINVKLVDDKANLIGTGAPINGYYTILPITPTLKVEPTTYEAKKTGEIFSVNITLSNILASAKMASIEFKLNYTATQIKLVNVTEGSFLSGVAPTTFNYTLLDNGVRVQNYLNPPYSNFPNGSGTIATITFEAIYRGFYPEEINSTLDLREIVLLDSKQSEMPFAYADGLYRILPYRWPVAFFTISPSIRIVSQTINFNASGSYDPDGYIVSYTWNFGDGNITTVITPTFSHVYQAPGTYNVNLTVTDDDELTNSTLESIVIGKLSSTITLFVDVETVTVGSSVVISGAITPVRVNVDVTISSRVTGGTWANLTTVQTVANGHYAYTWPVTVAGTYELKASWLGDANTLPAESGFKTVKVVEAPMDTWLYVILAIIIILAIIVSIIVYRKKIRKHEPSM